MDLFTPENVFWLSVLGVATGLFAGLLGIGGGVVMIPAFTLFFGLTNPHFVKGVSFTCMIFTSAASAVGHYRSGTMFPKVVKCLVPAALVGVVLGYLFGRMIPDWSFQVSLGAFLVYVAAMNAKSLIAREEPKGCAESEVSAGAASCLGLPMGVIVGVLGVGGGNVAVPCQQVFLKIGIKNSIANSSIAMIPAVLAGFFVSLGGAAACGDYAPQPWWGAMAVAALMVPWLIAGAYGGARLTAILPVKAILLVFTAILVFTAAQMMWVGIRSAAG